MLEVDMIDPDVEYACPTSVTNPDGYIETVIQTALATRRNTRNPDQSPQTTRVAAHMCDEVDRLRFQLRISNNQHQVVTRMYRKLEADVLSESLWRFIKRKWRQRWKS